MPKACWTRINAESRCNVKPRFMYRVWLPTTSAAKRCEERLKLTLGHLKQSWFTCVESRSPSDAIRKLEPSAPGNKRIHPKTHVRDSCFHYYRQELSAFCASADELCGSPPPRLATICHTRRRRR